MMRRFLIGFLIGQCIMLLMLLAMTTLGVPIYWIGAMKANLGMGAVCGLMGIAWPGPAPRCPTCGRSKHVHG